MLTDADVDEFVRDGAVALRGAVHRELADECRSLLWSATGCEPGDPSTWIQPVVRVDFRVDAPLRTAANSPALHDAFDRLAGAGRWSRLGGLGTFPVRFPSDQSPGDDGWHVESTGADDRGRPIVDPGSHERVLLLLFLFSDVGADDAPTRVRLGSHRTAADILRRDGVSDFVTASAEIESATRECAEALATGAAGDVWLCHPFVLHCAQPHRGTRVRFMAQPPLPGTGPIDPARPPGERSAVERAIA